jgi:MFS family permease
MFGSIFFLSQFLQTVQGYSPLSAGIRVLPWTGVTMLLAPVVGLLAERFGGKILVVSGLVFQAVALFWLATIVTPNTPYLDMVPAFVIAGVGMTLFFVPLASLVLGSVPTALEGVASGTNSAFRELGGVLGIAVLGAVSSGQAYVSGLTPAITVGAVVVAIGAVTAMLVPAVRRSRQREGEELAPEVTDVATGEGSDAAVALVGGPAHQPQGDGADGLQPALACSALSVDSR